MKQVIVCDVEKMHNAAIASFVKNVLVRMQQPHFLFVYTTESGKACARVQ